MTFEGVRFADDADFDNAKFTSANFLHTRFGGVRRPNRLPRRGHRRRHLRRFHRRYDQIRRRQTTRRRVGSLRFHARQPRRYDARIQRWSGSPETAGLHPVMQDGVQRVRRLRVRLLGVHRVSRPQRLATPHVRREPRGVRVRRGDDARNHRNDVSQGEERRVCGRLREGSRRV
ncbi:pentapeptide repeat-containing protein [Haladaptatus halobius]|uniref:pentapeptide repeat-containing protein n=1 Tax=Haladaptatus halobius TaxID=2884875 RepID=UPI001D0B5AEC|nr:pentapeptide repeat-containing protein [Haladaptatus halobius]